MNISVMKQWGTGKNGTWRLADSEKSAAFYRDSQAATGSLVHAPFSIGRPPRPGGRTRKGKTTGGHV